MILQDFFSPDILRPVLQAIEALNRLWDNPDFDSLRILGVSPIALSHWVGYGISLTDPQRPTITMFFNTRPGGRLLPPNLTIFELPVIEVDNTTFQAVPPAATVRGLQTPAPGAPLTCSGFDPKLPAVHPSTSGTLGVFVTPKARTGSTYILSANHVLAFNNPKLSRQIQLGGETVSRKVQFVSIKTRTDNLVDVAIAAYSGHQPIQPQIPGLPLTSPVATQPLPASPQVFKVGAGSCKTSGTAGMLSPRLSIDIPSCGLAGIGFDYQFLVKSNSSQPFSEPGDSGALAVLVDGQRREPFGMVIAERASKQGDICTVVTPLDAVTNALKSAANLDLQIII